LSKKIPVKPDKRQPVVSHWLNEIGSAKKREKDWRKEGKRILEIYGGEKSDVTPFNILYSNTETLLPALYSAVPRPVVQRRFKDEDPLGKSAATAGQRLLEFLLDTNIEGYETFDEGMRSATLDALLPGRGVTCVKYDAETGDLPPPKESPEAEPTPYKKSELICVDVKSWDRVYFGYAKKWSKVPWIAYEEYLDKEEATRLFGKEIADKIEYTKGEDSEDEKSSSENEDVGERKTALVYQIWDKDGGKKLRYVSPQYNDGYLKEEDDPLELTGFFNCPKPIQFLEKSNDLMPVALYELYENQAKELNQLTLRISRIVKAIKARGIYDAELGDDLKKLFEADDNEMVPADKSSSLAAEKGLQNAIWFAPIDVLMAVLEKLYQARESCKQVIYEITGISDIVRGASKASETLGAQELKSKYGTLRLSRLQKEVQRYARDMLRMMLELAASKFGEETWAKMTGLPFLLSAKFNELTEVSRALQMKAQAEQTQPGAPPSPATAQLQQVQQQLQTPQWKQILELLQDDMQRSYRIDIETNSTVEPEAVEDQKNISDVMTALGQYLNGVGPLVINGVMPFQAAQSMMLAIVRRFRFGSEIEDYVKAMQAPKPQDNGEQAKQQQQQMQKDQQAAQDKLSSQTQLAQNQLALEKMQHEKDLLERQTKLDIQEMQLNSDQQIFEIKKQSADKELTHKSAVENHKINTDRKVASLENSKYKTENVTNQKIDTKLTDGVKALQTVVKELASMQADLLKVVAENSTKHGEIVKAITAPRKRKIIRDKTGRAQEMVEEAAA
jgi:hypothetical protein